jgi:hypothetical protein
MGIGDIDISSVMSFFMNAYNKLKDVKSKKEAYYKANEVLNPYAHYLAAVMYHEKSNGRISLENMGGDCWNVVLYQQKFEFHFENVTDENGNFVIDSETNDFKTQKKAVLVEYELFRLGVNEFQMYKLIKEKTAKELKEKQLQLN